MNRIELSPYEKKDLLAVLDFALEEYKFRSKTEINHLDKSMARYWVGRIKELKLVVEGRVNPPSMSKDI